MTPDRILFLTVQSCVLWFTRDFCQAEQEADGSQETAWEHSDFFGYTKIDLGLNALS